jgi:hypothetical protein
MLLARESIAPATKLADKGKLTVKQRVKTFFKKRVVATHNFVLILGCGGILRIYKTAYSTVSVG